LRICCSYRSPTASFETTRPVRSAMSQTLPAGSTNFSDLIAGRVSSRGMPSSVRPAARVGLADASVS
jgi:hypothetical protein